MNLDECLPDHLRASSTTITPISKGLSGAGVYRVEARAQVFVLKISLAHETLAEWRCKVSIRQNAATMGLTPQVIHVDEARRAVLSAFVVDRSFPASYANPVSHQDALVRLGQMLRRVHELPMPPDARTVDSRELLGSLWSGPLREAVLPELVGDAVQRVLADAVPQDSRPLVLSHNDVNPTNLVLDGENLLLLDWDTAGRNDPFYDLATIAVFLRMDDSACLGLLSAHEGTPVATLPARFRYDRRLVAVLCGATFLHMAVQGGYSSSAALVTTPSLGEVYQRMRAGTLSPAASEGQWSLGLALVKESLVA